MQAIDRTERYTAALDAAGFAADTKTQNTAVRNIEVDGEAARNG